MLVSLIAWQNAHDMSRRTRGLLKLLYHQYCSLRLRVVDRPTPTTTVPRLCHHYVPTMPPLCHHYAPTMPPLCAHYVPSRPPPGAPPRRPPGGLPRPDQTASLGPTSRPHYAATMPPLWLLLGPHYATIKPSLFVRYE